MNTKRIVISGTGCALADFLYRNISFNSPEFMKYLSKEAADGGLCPGRLIFTEELEKFSGRSYNEILKEITDDKPPDAFNVGGPSLVSLIHASQMLGNKDFEVRFFGLAGKDETAAKIFKMLKDTPLNIQNYQAVENLTSPFTDVFSDPFYDSGHGERTFVNNIGAAWNYSPEMLTDDFYNSRIACFGGTALVPQIHDNLTFILNKARTRDCITVVNTVFDFRNEKRNPEAPWPLVHSEKSFSLIDILIMDREEALRISFQKTILDAASWFYASGVKSFIITNGRNDVFAWSGGDLFEKTSVQQFPVSERVTKELADNPDLKGDTTGCGDNFAGGIIASVASQLKKKSGGKLDLVEALSWGMASGGFCCYTLGGTYHEKFPFEKRSRILELQKDYLIQIGY